MNKSSSGEEESSILQKEDSPSCDALNTSAPICNEGGLNENLIHPILIASLAEERPTEECIGGKTPVCYDDLFENHPTLITSIPEEVAIPAQSTDECLDRTHAPSPPEPSVTPMELVVVEKPVFFTEESLQEAFEKAHDPKCFSASRMSPILPNLSISEYSEDARKFTPGDFPSSIGASLRGSNLFESVLLVDSSVTVPKRRRWFALCCRY